MPLKTSLYEWTTLEERESCFEVAVCRTIEQIKDLKGGMKSANFSYGKQGNSYSRSFEDRLNHAYLGACGEFIAAKYAKSHWTKESGQYKGNSKSDLVVNYAGNTYSTEVRASKSSFAIVRHRRDFPKNEDKILIVIADMPDNPYTPNVPITIGHRKFDVLKEVCKRHPEYKRAANSDSPYYAIELKYFDGDRSLFESFV